MRRPHGTACLLAVALALASGCGSDRSAPEGGNGGAPSTGAVSGSGGLATGGGLGSGATSGGGVAAGTGAVPSSGGATACHGTGESCQDSLDCCEGSTCNNTAQSPELNGCHPRCSQNTECQTGCCLLFTGDTRGICTDAKWCGCGTAGSKCGSTSPECCDDHVCLASDPQQTAYDCKKRCQANTDCATNCCVPIPSLNLSACLAANYCPAPPP